MEIIAYVSGVHPPLAWHRKLCPRRTFQERPFRAEHYGSSACCLSIPSYRCGLGPRSKGRGREPGRKPRRKGKGRARGKNRLHVLKARLKEADGDHAWRRGLIHYSLRLHLHVVEFVVFSKIFVSLLGYLHGLSFTFAPRIRVSLCMKAATIDPRFLKFKRGLCESPGKYMYSPGGKIPRAQSHPESYPKPTQTKPRFSMGRREMGD
jgi:hypothetical protein